MTEWNQAAYEAAQRHVSGYVLYPIRDWTKIDPEERARLLKDAELVFRSTPGHPCYWNDNFAVAVTCNMSEEKQRQAAWCLVTNGLNGYWEWFTHAGYQTQDVLHHLRITIVKGDGHSPDVHPTGIPWDSMRPGYSSPNRELLAKIAKHFKLPTTKFWDRPIEAAQGLSPKQLEERSTFNALYPPHETAHPQL